MSWNNITPAWALKPSGTAICRQCGEKINIEESQSGCRDPHCPFIFETDLAFDDLDD